MVRKPQNILSNSPPISHIFYDIYTHIIMVHRPPNILFTVISSIIYLNIYYFGLHTTKYFIKKFKHCIVFVIV